ncbi:MAG: methyltransferase domain-containing protein [Bacteroidia bacterium]|nr:methyltransferase domain-containing protein [Bacteroidia bacterium]
MYISRSLVLLTVLFFSGAGCTKYVIPPSQEECTRIAQNNGFVPDATLMIRAMEQEFSIYDFHPGEWVADIGAGSGWFEGVCALEFDSLRIDAVDVYASHVKESKPTIEEFVKLRKSPNTNNIQFVKGKKKGTGLPLAAYDKVILRQTFHHFEKKDAMLKDIRRIMEADGKLYVYEPVSERSEYFRGGKCFHYTREDLLRIFERNGFKLVAEHKLLGNPGNVPPWIDVRTEDIIPMCIYVFR